MENYTDNELVVKVREHQCNDSLKSLIERHTPLCFDIYKKYSKILSDRGVSQEDIADEKNYIIYKCTLSFKENQNSKFSTWVASHIKYKCLTLISKHKWSISIDDENYKNVVENLTCIVDENEEEKSFIFNILAKMKDKRLSRIIELRYYGDKSTRKWKNISKDIGITYQTAITLHKKALNFLSTKIGSKDMQDVV